MFRSALWLCRGRAAFAYWLFLSCRVRTPSAPSWKRRVSLACQCSAQDCNPSRRVSPLHLVNLKIFLAQAVSMLTSLLPSINAAIGFVVGTWSGGSTRCVCHCQDSVDQQILAVLQRQLDRCRPDKLTLAPPASFECKSSFSLSAVLFIFLVGVFTGCILAVWLTPFLIRYYGSARAASPRSTEPTIVVDSIIGRSSNLRAQRPDRRIVARTDPGGSRGRVVVGGSDSDS